MMELRDQDGTLLMSVGKTGGPAFPICIDLGQGVEFHKGMTLRDYFAAQASEEDLKVQSKVMIDQIRARMSREQFCFDCLPDDWRVKARYMHADAMLKARTA
jgi:hypothetical protein